MCEMGTREYSINEPLAFLIDKQVAPFIILAHDRRIPVWFKAEVAPELEKAGVACNGVEVSMEAFAKAVIDKNPVLNKMDYTNLSLVQGSLDSLGLHSDYASEVCGEINYFGEDGKPSLTKELEYNDIAYIPCDREMSPLHHCLCLGR